MPIHAKGIPLGKDSPGGCIRGGAVWVFEKQLFTYCKTVGIKRPRSKYMEQATKQLAYNRRKKKSYKQTRVRIKTLLYITLKGD